MITQRSKVFLSFVSAAVIAAADKLRGFVAALALPAIILGNSLTPTPAQAEYIEPGSVTIKTEPLVPVISNFGSGTYTYDVKWQGIKVAQAAVEVAKDNQHGVYQVTANAKTNGIIAMLYKLDHTSQSVFLADSFKPLMFSSVQQERAKNKTRLVRFGPGGLIIAEQKDRDSKKGTESEKKLEFVTDNYTFDPIAAAFFARSLDIELGKTASFDVFNGKHRFLITFDVEARETIKVLGEKRDTYRVVPSVKKLTDSEGEKRLQSAKIWITADQDREIVKLESKVFIGSVSASLRKIEATEITPKLDALQVAALSENPS